MLLPSTLNSSMLTQFDSDSGMLVNRLYLEYINSASHHYYYYTHTHI